jgi:hypothetical protein
MSRPVITISINGAAAVDVASIACQVGARTRYNQAADELSLTFPRAVAQALPLAYDDSVAFAVDGDPYFSGKVGQAQVSMGETGGTVSFTVHGPWKLLERWPALRVFSTNAPAITNTVGHAADWTPKWTLFSYPSFVGLAPTGYAVIQALYGPEYLTRAAPHFESGLIPSGIVPPAAVEITGSSVAAAIIQALRGSPDVSIYFDYSVSPPEMKFGRFVAWGSETSYAFSRAGTPWTLSTGTHDFSETAVALTLGAAGDAKSYNLAAARELNPPVLALRTEFSGTNATQWEPAATLANAPDALWIMNTKGVAGAGTAAALYDSRGGLRTDGEIVLQGDRPNFALHPGSLLTLTGDDAATGAGAGAAAWVQAVTDDLSTGETRLRLGFPNWLGEGDRLGNWLWCRRVGLSAN